MQPRQRYLAALAGQMPDRVPFVIWNNKLPGGDIDRQLLELEACIIVKSTVYRLTTPGIETKTEQLESKDGLPRTKKVYHTPAGTLSTTLRLYPGSTWLEKMPFTGPEDYEPLEAFIRSKTYPPCYDDFLKDDRKYADQSIARPETIYTPIQDLICKYMGVEAFCIEWSDRRDRLLKLYDVIAQDRRKRLELVADSPARFAVIEGNIIVDVTGPKRFEKYHTPHIEEACEILHAHGKFAGAHLDDNNKILASAIAKTSLDLIESFTPPPDCNLPLAEARRLWPEKTVQINFPSSLHLQGPEHVRKAAADILKQAAPGNRFIVGVSEDISGRGVKTLVPLAQTIHHLGQTPITTS
ncbi:MAG: uroporphyrinogen decarboxylase family protein [Planctomycetota bacterium]|jgi:hypothetical protein